MDSFAFFIDWSVLLTGYVSVIWRRWQSFFAQRTVRIWLGVLVSGVALFLALRGVNYQQVASALGAADPWWVALTLIVTVVNHGAKAIRWQLLLGTRLQHVSLWEVLRILMIGQMLNAVVPGRVGEVSRAVMLGSQGPGRTFVLGTVAIEKLQDLICYAVLFLLLVTQFALPAWISQPVWVLSGIALFGVVVVLVLLANRRRVLLFGERLIQRLPERLQERLRATYIAVLASFDELRSSHVLFGSVFWSLVVWVTAVLTNYLTFVALDMQATVLASVLILIVLQAGIVLPSVPGKVGVFQYLCVLTLGLLAVDGNAALAYGFLLHALVFVPMILFGVALLWFTKGGQQTRARMAAEQQTVSKS
jgi:uncharacterized protein (TIRG00374 family)